MTKHIRTEKEQCRLNKNMRRKDVLEKVLLESLHAEPASEEQVKRFLAVAPPEVFVLLDGLIPTPSQTRMPNEPLHENRIVQGFVGMVLGQGACPPGVPFLGTPVNGGVQPRAHRSGNHHG